MKLPRDISGPILVKQLETLGYQIARQTGSHIRLSKNDPEHHITVPNHAELKIGTLNSILQDVARHHQISKSELIQRLF